MTSATSPDRGLDEVPLMADADAVNAICAVLNTTDRGPDAVEEIVRIVRAAGRPYVPDLPVIDTYTSADRHGLPRADIEVDGEQAVAVWADDRGQVCVWVAPATPGRPVHLAVDHPSSGGA